MERVVETAQERVQERFQERVQERVSERVQERAQARSPVVILALVPLMGPPTETQRVPKRVVPTHFLVPLPAPWSVSKTVLTMVAVPPMAILPHTGRSLAVATTLVMVLAPGTTLAAAPVEALAGLPSSPRTLSPRPAISPGY